MRASSDKMQVIYGAMSSLESGKFVQKVKYGCELEGRTTKRNTVLGF
jgi:4-hydroxy-tetrahydrodipicolinate synthase